MPLPVHGNGPGPDPSWGARAADACNAGALSTRRERADAPGVPALIDALDAYQRALYPAAGKPLPDLEALLQPQIRLLVVRDAREQALACGALLLQEDHAELKRMVVAPAQRGRGLGAALVRGLEREALLAGRPLLRLETGVRQRAAQRLYERMGFERCGPFGAYRGDPFAVFMEKLLG